MKRSLIYIMITACILNSASAVPGKEFPAIYGNSASELLIKSTGAPVSVSIDNLAYPGPLKKIDIPSIGAGNHFIQIYADEIVYRGRHAIEQPVMIYSGNIFLQPASIIESVIDNSGRFYVKGVRPIVNYYVAVPAAPMPMEGASFSQLLGVMHEQWSDDSRVAVLQQALQSNWFTSPEVEQMMHECWYEDTKLDIAKAAYLKVVDPGNYFLVDKEFYYSDSADALNAYIQSCR